MRKVLMLCVLAALPVTVHGDDGAITAWDFWDHLTAIVSESFAWIDPVGLIAEPDEPDAFTHGPSELGQVEPTTSAHYGWIDPVGINQAQPEPEPQTEPGAEPPTNP